MKAKYQMVAKPDLHQTNEPQPLRPRLVEAETVSIIEMMEYAKSYSTLSTADVKGALQLVAELLEQGLREGKRVEIDGIGFFTVSLESRPVMDKSEIRSTSVHFSKVLFRLNKEMKKRLKGMPLEREPEAPIRFFTLEEREARLWRRLEKEESITSSVYMALNHCTKYQALKDLKNLVDSGLLKTTGYRNTRSYKKK